MQQSHSLIRLRRSVLAAACLIGLGTAAHAAPPSADGAPPEHRGPMMERMHERMEHRLDELHQQLALDKNQETQWQNARQVSDKLHREMMDAHRATHEKLKAALDAPNPDLRALAAEMDKARDEQAQKHKQAREAWLKFYDGLKPEQKEKARHFLLSQISMMGEHGPHHMQEGMRPHHGGPGSDHDMRLPPGDAK